MSRTALLAVALSLVLFGGSEALAQNQALVMSNAASDGFFDVPASATLAPPSITVEAWLTYDETTLAPGAGFRFPTVARKNTAPGQEEWFLRVQALSTSNRVLDFVVRTTGGNVGTGWAFGAGEMLTPTHIAGTYDGAFVRMYVNGSLVSERAAPGTLVDLGGDLRVGGGDPGVPENWNGTIDELRVWSAARTEAEINATLFSQSLAGLPALEASWSLDGFAIDLTGNGNGGTFTGTPTYTTVPFPMPAYETNDDRARFTVDGVEGSSIAPARVSSPVCVNNDIAFASNLAATAFEAVVTPGGLVAGGSPGSITTPGGQIVNVELGRPGTFFLNGGAALRFLPFPGPFNVAFGGPTPIALSGQAVFLDPGSADGIAISQGSELDRTPNTGPVAGPTSDDGTVLVDLSAQGCGPIDFLGTSYTQLGMASNGRVTLSGVDGDFSPSLAEATTDLPMLGAWTDLNPSNGGTISFTDSGSQVRIDYAGVPYFGEATTISFSIIIDRVGGGFTLDGLTGIVANPGTAISSSDAMFLGFSPGSAASGGAAADPGATTYAVGGAGSTASLDEMSYDFVQGATAGTPWAPASLAPGTLNTISFFTTPTGVTWVGL